jgi:hypothetical protein
VVWRGQPLSTGELKVKSFFYNVFQLKVKSKKIAQIYEGYWEKNTTNNSCPGFFQKYSSAGAGEGATDAI